MSYADNEPRLADQVVQFLDDMAGEPQAPEWNGEGKPPVGALVEYEGNNVEVVAHDLKEVQFCARHADGQLSILRPWWVRPIQSAEDRAVDEMCDSADSNTARSRYLFRQLYRAGYRKAEG